MLNSFLKRIEKSEIIEKTIDAYCRTVCSPNCLSQKTARLRQETTRSYNRDWDPVLF